MKASLCTPPDGGATYEDVELQAMGSHDVRVHVDASGVCRTDLSLAHGLAGSETNGVPIVLGHEGSGTVLAVGSDVTRCAVGDRVISSFVPNCGNCFYCVRGNSNQCERFQTEGYVYSVTRADGSAAFTMAGLGTFSEEMIIHEHAVVPVRTDLPSEQLALIGCGVTTGAGAALWTAKVDPGSTVAVFGCGGVGQFVVQGARIAGAARIVAVDPIPMKRQVAEQLGATDSIDPSQGDAAEQIKDLTGGRGVDFAFEAIGSPAAILEAYNSVRKQGKVVVVGMAAAGSQIALDPVALFVDEKHLVGSFYGSCNIREHFPMLVRLAESGQLDIGAAVSRRIKLSEVNGAFRAIEQGEVVRSVITNT